MQPFGFRVFTLQGFLCLAMFLLAMKQISTGLIGIVGAEEEVTDKFTVAADDFTSHLDEAAKAAAEASSESDADTLPAESKPPTSSSEQKNAPDSAEPWREFDSWESSPMFFMSGLQLPPKHYVIAKVYDHHNNRTEVAGQLNLTTILLPNQKLDVVTHPSRVFALPGYQLNHTTLLRIAIWYPCRDPPQEFGFTIAPCWFRQLTWEEYNSKGDLPPKLEGGKRATFYFRFHDPPTPGNGENEDGKTGESQEPRDLQAEAQAYRESQDDLKLDSFDSRDQESLQSVLGYTEAKLPEDHRSDDATQGSSRSSDHEDVEEEFGELPPTAVRATTKAVCWLPAMDVLETGMTKLDIADHGYLARIGGLFYQSEPSYSAMFQGDDDPYQDPAAWYFFSTRKHWPVEKQRYALYGRSYCRSWFGVIMENNQPCRWYGYNGERLQTEADRKRERAHEIRMRMDRKKREEMQRRRREKRPDPTAA